MTSESTKPQRRTPGACVAEKKQLILNSASLQLLTNGGRESVRFVAVIELPDGKLAIRPLDLPAEAVSVVRLSDERRVSAILVSNVVKGQRLQATWNDLDGQLELTPAA